MSQATIAADLGSIPEGTLRRAAEALARQARRSRPVDPEEARKLLTFYAAELAKDREEKRVESIEEARDERDEYATLRASALGIFRGEVWVPEQ